MARNEDEFKRLMWEHMKELAEEQSDGTSRRNLSQESGEQKAEEALPRVRNSGAENARPEKIKKNMASNLVHENASGEKKKPSQYPPVHLTPLIVHHIFRPDDVSGTEENV